MQFVSAHLFRGQSTRGDLTGDTSSKTNFAERNSSRTNQNICYLMKKHICIKAWNWKDSIEYVTYVVLRLHVWGEIKKIFNPSFFKKVNEIFKMTLNQLFKTTSWRVFSCDFREFLSKYVFCRIPVRGCSYRHALPTFCS